MPNLQDLIIKITTMKMMFHIDDFKCTLCANWFCPPFNLPYLLPCTHSICTSCLQKSSNDDHIICPEDLEACPIQSININLATKKALERLMKEHKNYNQNTQLECIKSLSINFDQVLISKEKQLRNLEGLIDQIFHSEIQRLKHIHEKIKTDINRPYRIVEDWKEIVATHLTNIRKQHHNSSHDSRSNSMLQLNHYIEEGRKIKMQLNQFFQLEFDSFADKVMRNPRVCFDKDFSITQDTLQNKLKAKNTSETVIKTMKGTTDKKEKEKRQLIEETKSKMEQYEPIESSTIVISSQNRKTFDSKNKSRPLSNIDLNRAYNSQNNDIQNSCIETQRGHLKEKGENLRSQLHQNENVVLGKYIGNQNLKNNSKNHQRKESEQKSKKNSAVSPLKQNKNNKIKNNKQQLKLNERIDSRNSFNYVSNESKSQQFTLSQFQLETIQNDSQPNLKQKIKSVKQSTQNHRTASQKSPSQNSQKYNSTQQDRMNRLAQMLENISSQTSHRNSSRNSLRKSRKNSMKRAHQTSGENSLLMSPNTICQQYTEEAQDSQPYDEEQLLNNEEMLVSQDKTNGWQMGNINFLREWKLKNQNTLEHPLQIRQNTYYYNCQKEKLSYMRKMQIHRVQQALKLTVVKENFIQLINESLHDVDMGLYLEQFDWKRTNIEIVKFVKTSMTDEQLNILLNFLIKSNVKALVLSGNNLTDICLDALLNFVTMNHVLKNVYLPKNYINILKSKAKINLLKERGVNIYV